MPGPALSSSVAEAVKEARQALQHVETLAREIENPATPPGKRLKLRGQLDRAIRQAVQAADAYIVSV